MITKRRPPHYHGSRTSRLCCMSKITPCFGNWAGSKNSWVRHKQLRETQTVGWDTNKLGETQTVGWDTNRWVRHKQTHLFTEFCHGLFRTMAGNRDFLLAAFCRICRWPMSTRAVESVHKTSDCDSTALMSTCFSLNFIALNMRINGMQGGCVPVGGRCGEGALQHFFWDFTGRHTSRTKPRHQACYLQQPIIRIL
jgi:hypothetical protein